MWSLSLSQGCTCMTPAVPVLLLQRCPAWGRACRYCPGDDLSIPLLFSEGAASLKSLYFCTDVVFSTPVPQHPGQAAAAQQGDSASLSLVTRVTLVEGTHSQYPPHQEFGVFWGAGSQAASLTFIPGSLQMRWEGVVPTPQQHRVRLVTEPLVPPREK